MADTITPFLGLRASDDFVTDGRPKNWRAGILLQYPNGIAPLTALTSLMKSETTDDPEFNWWEKVMPSQYSAITAGATVFTDSGLSAAYAGSGAIGATWYIKAPIAFYNQCKVNHQISLLLTTDLLMTVNCIITTKTAIDASYGKLTVITLEADDNSTNYSAANADAIAIVGNVNAEGATIPTAIAYDPNKRNNYTQIFRDSLSMTRTAQKTRLRTGDQVREARREALELHMLAMEKAWIFGVPREWTAAGETEIRRTTAGLLHVIRDRASDNISNWITDATYAGKSWTAQDGGYTWLNKKLELIFRLGDTEKLCLCGSEFLAAISRLAETIGQVNLTPRQKVFGIQVVEWVTPHGILMLKTHPLMTQNAALRQAGIILEPRGLRYRYITDTTLKRYYSNETPYDTADAKKEEYLTECGLEYHFPTQWGILYGAGEPNTAAG